MAEKTKFLVHCDGSVRLKEGASMSSFVIVSSEGDLVYQDALRNVLSNPGVAELFALRLAMEESLRRGVRDVTFVSDSSSTVSKVMNLNSKFKGKYKTELNFQLMVVRALMRKFDRVRVIYQNRKLNKYADSLCRLGWDNVSVRRSGGNVDVTKEAVLG